VSPDDLAALSKDQVGPSSGVGRLKTSACKRRLTAHLGLMMALSMWLLLRVLAGIEVPFASGMNQDQHQPDLISPLALMRSSRTGPLGDVGRTGHPGTNTTWRTELLKDLLQSKGPAPFKRVNSIF
jgi:hypothetical protein